MDAIAQGRSVSIAFGVAIMLVPTLQAQGKGPVDTAQAVRWLNASRAALDSSADDLRVPVALAYATAGHPADALALSHAPAVLVAAACASMKLGDTTATDTTLDLGPDGETRGWLLARLAQRHLRLWWNRPATNDRATRAARITDRIAWPEARVWADLSLAYHLVESAHDTLAAQARLAGVRAAYAAITDTVRRAELAGSMAWLEAAVGEPAEARRFAGKAREGGDQAWALARVAMTLRARGRDPRPTLLEAEFLALARPSAAARARAIDGVISGYDSVAEAKDVQRLRALRPVRPLPVPTRLDSAMGRLEAGDTAGAERLVRTLPDPRRIGYRASAMQNLAYAYRAGPGLWHRAAQLFRDAVPEARRIRDRSVRLSVLRSLASAQEGLGTDGDTRRLPDSRRLQDTLLRDAEMTAELLPSKDRIAVLRRLASAWGDRSPGEARRLLRRLPTYADSVEALRWMVYRVQSADGLDSLRAALGGDLPAVIIANASAARRRSAPDSTVIDANRAALAKAVLPRDTSQIKGLIGMAGAGDTSWLGAWAAHQPTSLARVAAYRALGLAALTSTGMIWGGWSESCLDE